MSKIGTRDEYKKVLGDRKFIGKEGCPFCDQVWQEDMILWTGEHWMVIQNKYPYTGTTDHIMAVPTEHHVHAVDFPTEVWSELGEVHKWIQDFYGTRGYFSFTRETMSDGDRDTRSIEHYHTHFLPGRLQGKYIRKMLQNQGFPVEQDLIF